MVTAWNNVSSIVRKQKNTSKLHKQMQGTLDHLFDIMKCQCTTKCVDDLGNHTDCVEQDCDRKKQHKHQINCICVKEFKIPVLELPFIRAQRLKVGDKCVYQMGADDKPESKRQQDTLDRKDLDLKRKMVTEEKDKLDEEKNLRDNERVKEFLDEIPDEAEGGKDDEDDLDYLNDRITRMLNKSDQNRSSFPTVASVSMRYGASNRMTAAIATATIIDLGIVTADDKSKVFLSQQDCQGEKKTDGRSPAAG